MTIRNLVHVFYLKIVVLIWENVEALCEKDIWSNHYVPNSLKSEPSLNPLNSKVKVEKILFGKLKVIQFKILRGLMH